jgi:PIN domain nuclease of toxin-antitoxin system
VLDSYAVLAFLFQEAGHEKVVSLLEKAVESDKTLLVAAPN